MRVDVSDMNGSVGVVGWSKQMFVAQFCLLVLCSRAGLCCLVKSNRYDASEVNERLSEVVSAVRLRAAVMSVVAGRRTLMPRPVRIQSHMQVRRDAGK